jgi:hypothetical protein
VAVDRDEVRIDFHTHTSASHDVPGWFTPARRRAWHRAAGYDAVYVSDHKRVAGALEAARANPVRAGDGLVVLPAIEAWWNGIHVVVLGATAVDSALVTDDQMERAIPAALASGRLAGLPSPVGFATIPDDVLRALTRRSLDSAAWIRGAEVVDGAPRGLTQQDRDLALIAERAAALGLVPLAATNHHGWGRTAVAWNLVRVPGWRSLPPAALGARIEDVLRRGERSALRVVARARPRTAPAGPARAATLVATLPTLVWRTAAELPPGERVVWLAWLWTPAALGAVIGARRRRRAG